MTRDEFVTRCDDLSSETKYSSKPWHIWLAEMTAHDAEQRAEIARLREALQYYADKDQWGYTTSGGFHQQRCLPRTDIAQQALKESIK